MPDESVRLSNFGLGFVQRLGCVKLEATTFLSPTKFPRRKIWTARAARLVLLLSEVGENRDVKFGRSNVDKNHKFCIPWILSKFVLKGHQLSRSSPSRLGFPTATLDFAIPNATPFGFCPINGCGNPTPGAQFLYQVLTHTTNIIVL
jgi:hypothetical protein